MVTCMGANVCRRLLLVLKFTQTLPRLSEILMPPPSPMFRKQQMGSLAATYD